MITQNPGNLLKFTTEGYNSNHRPFQRHKQVGQDAVPFGLIAPRTRLLPFQMYFEGISAAVLNFSLISPTDDSTTIILDPASIGVYESAGGSWIVWNAAQNLDVIPDCGYWYVFLSIDGAGQYVSEVMELRDICGFETIALKIQTDSCESGPTTVGFVLEADIYAAPGYTYTIQRKTGLTWDIIATDDPVTVTETKSNEGREYRIQVTTACGLIITASYAATWTAADPCGTLTLGSATISRNEAGILAGAQMWRLNFGNTKDKGQVLYQEGYTQHLYFDAPIYDAPEVIRETDIRLNGNGEEIRRRTRTVERYTLEIADLPDYALAWLAKAGDLDDITLEDVRFTGSLQEVLFPVSNLQFESRRQGPGLHIGRFSFEADAETFNGCQQDFTLIV